ncbi:MAG: hypothetical protein ACRBCI_12095 [Cellvibrionaceae bacterium]
MDIPTHLSTNKTLLKITPLVAFRDLKIKCFPESESQTLEQLQSMPGYYLMDTPRQEGYQEPIRQKAVREISTRIFNQELTETGIALENWPNIYDFDEFKKYFKVEHLALIADLGKVPLETKELPGNA